MKTYKEKETKQLKLLKKHLQTISQKGKGYIFGGGEIDEREGEL